MKPALLLLFLLSLRTFAAEPSPVVDLRTLPNTPSDSAPFFFGTVRGVALFTARTSSTERAIWRTDGTAEGTFALLEGIAPRDYRVIADGDLAYFLGSDKQVWRTDGTRAGTVAVAQNCDQLATVIEGRVVCVVRYRLVAGGAVLHSGPSDAQWVSSARAGAAAFVGTPWGLFRTDGTVRGTKRIVPQPAWDLTVAGDLVFFRNDGELWVSDGTEGGTHMVIDQSVGNGRTFDEAGFGETLASLRGGVLFATADGRIGWSDGTASGTRILLEGERNEGRFAIVGDVAYFGFDDRVHGHALWRTDGTDAGTWMVRDGTSDQTWIRSVTAGATRVYYYDGGFGMSLQLFESDGTPEGTRALSGRGHPETFRLVTIGDTVFFANYDPVIGLEPWVREPGRDARMIMNVAIEGVGSSNPQWLLPANRLWFIANGDTRSGIWSTDGTSAGTAFELELRGNPQDPLLYAAAGDTLYLRHGDELRTQHGPLRRFRRLSPSVAVAVGGRLYFQADTQLWITDGTADGTRLLTNLSGETYVGPVTTFAGRQYFTGGDPVTLYTTDGTPEGTHSIARMEGPRYSVPSAPIPHAGALLVFKQPSFNATELWKFSGAAADATLVTTIPHDFAYAPVSVGTAVLFAARNGRDLWRTDGTAAGTYLLHSFTRLAYLPRSAGGRVLFSAEDREHEFELWVSDGTIEGTKLLRDFVPGARAGNPTYFTVADGIIYFIATDDEHGYELWQSDGTAEGTRLVADIVPGAAHSLPWELRRMGDALYFAATRPDVGRELWTYPLPGIPAVTMGDVRVSAHAQAALLPVRLTRASSRRVTVTYDGGTLVFEPGETQKTIALPARATTIVLREANVPIEKIDGSVIVEKDVLTDIRLSLLPSRQLEVRNDGPHAASDVRLCFDGTRCLEPFELRAGESRAFAVEGDAFTARATQWQRDARPRNNELTAVLTERLLLAHDGDSGTITVLRDALPRYTVVPLTSSDPTIVRVPSTLTIPPNATSATATFRVLKSGTVTITAGTASATLRAVRP